MLDLCENFVGGRVDGDDKECYVKLADDQWVIGKCSDKRQGNIASFSSDPTIFSYELHMRQIHSEKGGFAVCEYCSKEFTGSIGKVKFALKEHIQVGWEMIDR